MDRRQFVAAAATGLLLNKLPALRADEIEPQYRKVIDKGLEWVAKAQSRDGHWDANGGQYPTTMTSLAGIVLLMEGSTMREGKYAEKIRKAVDWLLDRTQRNGLIGNPNNATETGRYMYGHGFSLLFLASVCGEEEDADRRKKLEEVLTRAVEFCGKSQTDRGGWGYVSAADGGGFDEGSVTITQLQGLRAARNAGIVVPKTIIDKSREYLRKCTTPKGGIIYSLANGAAMNGGERPALTAAAVACSFSSGEYSDDYAKKWIEYCRTAIPIGQVTRQGHDEYLHYYFGQALYILGDKGYAKLFPKTDEKDHMTWSKYKKAMFEHLVKTQTNEGSWTGGYIGPIYSTSVYLTLLQLENSTLPIYQR
ncbi:MAG: terpene cyclase/mutase family protein [Gemmataceae bacterium]|nr:terpene cyclase/mutase family protein [Gemmataceae bacterium]